MSIQSALLSIPPIFFLVFGITSTLLVLAVTMPKVPTEETIRVAFVGNSITYFHDLPRVLQAMSGNHIQQNSCLHGCLNFMSMMRRGNGMYKKWKTKKAILNRDWDGHVIYDYGACSFPQLLFGRDDNLYLGGYRDDGMNPCLMSSSYASYLNATYVAEVANGTAYRVPPTTIASSSSSQQQRKKTPRRWDYVIMNDHTRYPGIPKTRRTSLLALKEVYANMLLEAGSRPVFLVTHAYPKKEDTSTTAIFSNSSSTGSSSSGASAQNYADNSNQGNEVEDQEKDSDDGASDEDDDTVDDESSDDEYQVEDAEDAQNDNNEDAAPDEVDMNEIGPFEDIRIFTSRVYYGYQLYAEALAPLLPLEQQPLLAPAGLAFLVLWEENFGLWEKLFYYDVYHPSPHGTYLIACVVYATLYNRMPPAKYALPTDIGSLFAHSRRLKMHNNLPVQDMPTQEEANFLYHVADRVVLQRYRPKSLIDAKVIAAVEKNNLTWYNIDGIA